MKFKKFRLLAVSLVMLFALTTTAAAHSHNHHRSHHPPPGHPNWSHSSYQNNSWIHIDHHPVSITWGDHRNHFTSRYEGLTHLDEHEWRHRFPGLQAYRWQSRGHHDSFMYHGRRITHGVLFFNHADILVGIGFMHNGNFVFVRDDHRSFRNHDSFFVSWSHR